MQPTNRRGRQAHRPESSQPAARPLALFAGLVITIVVLVAAVRVLVPAAAIGDPPRPTSQPAASAAAAAGSSGSAASAPASAPSSVVGSGPAPSAGSSSSSLGGRATNVYADTGVGMFSPAVAGVPTRVYVPDEASGTVIEIDPATFKIIARLAVGSSPEHVTPDWDLRRLYVESTFSGRLTTIDPVSGRLSGAIPVPNPYNLYFSLDGSLAIDVVDRQAPRGKAPSGAQLYFYDRATWGLRKALAIPFAGADHLDFSADGKYLLISTEYSGYVVKVDMTTLSVVTAVYVGGSPTDVRLSPDGQVFYVANQVRNGVSVIDPMAMREVGFIPTGRGTHGLAISRDATRLYVTNRIGGTLSVIDFATRQLVATWRIGGSPDMIAVSADGTQLWISNRYNGTVSVVDSRTGRVIATIRTGGRPHGLAFFPTPGRLSLGHNGNNR